MQIISLKLNLLRHFVLYPIHFKIYFFFLNSWKFSKVISIKNKHLSKSIIEISCWRGNCLFCQNIFKRLSKSILQDCPWWGKESYLSTNVIFSSFSTKCENFIMGNVSIGFVNPIQKCSFILMFLINFLKKLLFYLEINKKALQENRKRLKITDN